MDFFRKKRKEENRIFLENFRKELDLYIMEKYVPCEPMSPGNAMMGAAMMGTMAKSFSVKSSALKSSAMRETPMADVMPPEAAPMESVPMEVEALDSSILTEDMAQVEECEEKSPVSRSLDEIVENVGENFSEMLLRLLIEKDLKNSEVYHNANISRKVFSKIMTNPEYHPKKNTVLALAIGMKLNLDETKDFMARAGYALSPGSKFDLIVQYCIEKREYNIVKINLVLDDYRQPCLGD